MDSVRFIIRNNKMLSQYAQLYAGKFWSSFEFCYTLEIRKHNTGIGSTLLSAMIQYFWDWWKMVNENGLARHSVCVCVYGSVLFVERIEVD